MKAVTSAVTILPSLEKTSSFGRGPSSVGRPSVMVLCSRLPPTGMSGTGDKLAIALPSAPRSPEESIW